jgi:hypothetical protein
MTLCGVLKTILIVVASVIIWGTAVSGLQFFGYSLATAGLIYYGLGYEGIVTCCNNVQACVKRQGKQVPNMTEGVQLTRVQKWVMISMYSITFILLVIGVCIKTGHIPRALHETVLNLIPSY